MSQSQLQLPIKPNPMLASALGHLVNNPYPNDDILSLKSAPTRYGHS